MSRVFRRLFRIKADTLMWVGVVTFAASFLFAGISTQAAIAFLTISAACLLILIFKAVLRRK